MKNLKQKPLNLGNEIDAALAMLDPRGVNQTVTQAMTIVRIGLSQSEKNQSISAEDLYKEACKIHCGSNS